MRPSDGSLFTPAEAAVLTSLSLKAVNNAIDKNMVSAVVRSGTTDAGRFLDQRALLALALEYRLANRFFPELRRRLFDALAASPRKAVLSVDEGLVKVDLQEPFAGPEAVLAYLSRYTHRVAISNSRLVAFDQRGVTFRWKDYRRKGRTRFKTMTLSTEEFMRRFLLHVLPSGFHRIRHYGLLANAGRKNNIDTVRQLLQQPPVPEVHANPERPNTPNRSVLPTFICRHCGAPMLIIETFERAQHIRAPPSLGRSP